MKTIHKYPLSLQDDFTLDLPQAAVILCVQTQNNFPYIWALVDTDRPIVTQRFALRGTGHDCEDVSSILYDYIGTFHLRGGELVFHLFKGATP